MRGADVLMMLAGPTRFEDTAVASPLRDLSGGKEGSAGRLGRTRELHHHARGLNGGVLHGDESRGGIGRTSSRRSACQCVCLASAPESRLLDSTWRL